MIILIGHIDVDPADAAAFIEDVRAITPIVRAEPGCLFHSLVPDDAAAGRMLLVQRWRDDAALAAHQLTPSTVAFQRKWLERLAINVQSCVVAP